MVELLTLARAGLGYLLKDEFDEVGRAPTAAVAPTASPGVPSEDTILPRRSSKEVIRDTITSLQDGLKIDDALLDSADQVEVSNVVAYLRKAMQSGPRDTSVSVKAIIRDKVGRTLVLRDAYSDYWDLPGGHVQEGETLEKALRREVAEEAGLQCGKCVQFDTRMMQLDTLRPVLFYKAEYIGGQVRCSEEHLGYQWASLQELPRLNLGVFKSVLIPGPGHDQEGLGVGYPQTQRSVQGPMQIPHYQVKDGGAGAGTGPGVGTGISGPGDTMVGEEVHTDTYDDKGRRELKALGDPDAWPDVLRKIATGAGHLITGDDTETGAPTALHDTRSTSGIQMKLVKGLAGAIEDLDLRVISKGRGPTAPFVVAGYASPVVVDQEGHRVSHTALAHDVPRFMAYDGRYANVNVFHTNATVGRLLPEFTSSDGHVYKTGVDEVGFFAVAEIRTDPYAPDLVQQVITDIETGKLRSFSISGNADNPVFTCDSQRCFYDIGKVNLLEVTLCEEGVNQDAKFQIVSK